MLDLSKFFATAISLMILLSIIACDSDDDKKGTLSKFLSWADLTAINSGNENTYTFEGNCVGSGEIRYSLVEEAAEPPSGNEFSIEDNVTCSDGRWEVGPIDFGTVEEAATVNIEVSLRGFTLRTQISKDTELPVLTVAADLYVNDATKGSFPVSGTCADGVGSVVIVLEDEWEHTAPNISVTCAQDETWSITVDTTVASIMDGQLTFTASYRDAADNLQEVVLSGVLRDTVAPTLDPLQVPSAATYSSSNLDFQVGYSEPVVVVGNPRLALSGFTDDSSNPRYATFSGGSGTDALDFAYPITTGDSATTVSVGADIDLNGGSIEDAAGNPAVIAGLSGAGQLTGVGVSGMAFHPLIQR